MWRLMKAELSYYKFALLLGFGVCVLVAVASWIWNWGDLNTPIANSAFSYFITIAIIGSDADKEKRDRLYSLLPLSLREIAHGRMLLAVLFQISIFLLWLIFLAVTRESVTLRTICNMLSFSALTLAMIMFFVIHHDLGYFGNNKRYYGIYYGFLGLAIVSIGFLYYIQKLQTVLKYLFTTLYGLPAGAILFSVFALGMYILSLRIFMRRKSYLA